MTFDAWRRDQEEWFVRAYAEARRAEAERDARIQVERAREWRAALARGESHLLAGYSDDPAARHYPDHAYAQAYSGIVVSSVAGYLRTYALRNPPPVCDVSAT